MVADAADFRIRAMARGDATVLHAIHCACLTHTLAAHYPPDVIAAWGEGRTPEGYLRAAEEGERFCVAETPAGVVGFASTKASELLALYVHPQAQGRGIGGALLAAAREGGAVRRLNAARGAEGFYTRRGFVAVGPGVTMKRGVALDHTQMVAGEEAGR